MAEKLYAERDIIAQGEFYTRHVCAMTAEGLWDKSSIAAELAHRDQRIAELEAENENLRTVMIAAAEEIKLHWEAHCDPVEGMGPVNLLRRLECGIPAEYGYKAGNFRRLMYRVKELEAAKDAAEKKADSLRLKNLKMKDILVMRVMTSTYLSRDGKRLSEEELPEWLRQARALLQEES